MKEIKRDKEAPLFQKGIWIKEQQGTLTIGSLDRNNDTVMEISDQLGEKIFQFENDMIQALYGEEAVAFDAAVVDVEKLLTNIGKQFNVTNLRISFSGTQENCFKGDYYEIYGLVEKLIQSSLTLQEKEPPFIHINVSVLQDHLHIIYRDSASISDPEKLKIEIEQIKVISNGEVNHKTTPDEKSYYDIMIPSKK